MTAHYDFAIVGAGIAGASLAAGLAPHGRVLLIEAEDQPGYHATGRSAAFWTESYGGPKVQPLTTASGPFLHQHGFLEPRGALTLARGSELAQLEAFAAKFRGLGVRVDDYDRAALEARLPGLRSEWLAGAYEPDCCDIDVAALHQHWLAAGRQGSVELWTRARLARAARLGQSWHLSLEDGRDVRATILINAAGAWADHVAVMASVRPLGIQPYRRTVAQLQLAEGPPEDLPLVLGLDELFYFKPEAGRLWLSPHDETPSDPCDAAPEELDIALAVNRFEQVVDWEIVRIEHRWAGLRSFAPDRLPVYGFDPAVPGFFWFAGQGGFGIQTAPAAAELACRLLLGEAADGIDPSPFGPDRFY